MCEIVAKFCQIEQHSGDRESIKRRKLQNVGDFSWRSVKKYQRFVTKTCWSFEVGEVLEACLRSVVRGYDAGAHLSAFFIDFAASQGFYLLNLRSSRSHTPGIVPRIAGFHFWICAALTRTDSAGCRLHFFPLLPPGLAARMMLRRSGFRSFQIGFKRCKRVYTL